MTIVKRAESLEEIDKILPLIREFHSDSYFYTRYSSETAFIAWIASGMINRNTAVWIAYNDDIAFGYAIATIVSSFFDKECVIVDAYFRDNDTDISQKGIGFIEDWAKEWGCKYISCFTYRDSAMKRKWQFETASIYMIKSLKEE